MKLVPEKENSYGIEAKISTQASNDQLAVCKGDADCILNGDVVFNPSKYGGIGTLEINGDEIPCLEREYRKDWEKIVRKMCKIRGLSEEETEQAVKRQPAPPAKREKKPRPTREQLATDPRYNKDTWY